MFANSWNKEAGVVQVTTRRIPSNPVIKTKLECHPKIENARKICAIETLIASKLLALVLASSAVLVHLGLLEMVFVVKIWMR